MSLSDGMIFSRILVTGGSGFIGTNLIEALSKRPELAILNIDLVAPKIDSAREYWFRGDIRDGQKLTERLASFAPDAVIHLAARTDLDGQAIDDYSTNTEGISRLLEALDSIGFGGPAIFASSMYVCRPGYSPASDRDFHPHTIYGESKVIGEQVVRDANPHYPWLIVRPTSIWGPWFGIPYADFFKLVLARRYVNISGNRTRKTYGFVGNTVSQLLVLLENVRDVGPSVVYLGDWPPYVINDWADEIAGFVPYSVPRVPLFVLQALALLGDQIKRIGVDFPMSSFRLSNMTTDNEHDLGPLKRLMGAELPYTRQQGNELTVQWLRPVAPIN